MSTLLRIDLSDTGNTSRSALVRVFLDALAGLINAEPRELRRKLRRNRGAMTIVVGGG